MSWFKKFKTQAETILSMDSTNVHQEEQQIGAVIDELQRELSETQVRIAMQTANVNVLRDRAAEIHERADRRHDETKLAVIHGDEDAAKRALLEEQTLRQQLASAEHTWKQAEDVQGDIRAHIAGIETQVLELENRRHTFVARLRTAEVAKALADIRAGIDVRGRAFQKMEDKVIHAELEAAAHEEVAGQLTSEPMTEEKADDVSQLLAELKDELTDDPPTK